RLMALRCRQAGAGQRFSSSGKARSGGSRRRKYHNSRSKFASKRETLCMVASTNPRKIVLSQMAGQVQCQPRATAPLADARAVLTFVCMSKSKPRKSASDIAVVGDVDDWEEEVVKALLEVPLRGQCVFYIDSAGGSVFGALAVLTLLRHRQIDATAIVIGECSSATLLLFAACRRRLVTHYSTLLFHRMRWQSEKRIDSFEASHWAT